MRANITYPPGGGVTLFADSNPENDPPEWEDVTTDCSIEPARRFVQRVRITEPGEGYTVAPMLSITGGGGTPSLDAWVEITSPVVEIEVTAPGGGYTSPPAVKFSGGGKIAAATAKAVIEGKITSVTLTNPGEGYAEPPEVVVLGGEGANIEPTMDGYVLSIAITNGGEGYTSAPSVTLSGGGGSGATGSVSFSKVSGVVTGGFVLTKGAGYTSPPEVTLSGGGGEGATAVAAIAFQVKSLAVTDGGDGYPFNPVVKFNGPALRSAAATAAIEGKVVAVNVANPGLYRHRRNAAGTVLIDWPTISIAGSATAEPKFSGKVTAIDPGGAFNFPVQQGPLAQDNKNYASVPDVTITTASGDVGTGATALAELNWQQEHERTADIVSCFADLANEACYSSSSELFPFPVQSDCITSGERFRWTIEAQLDFNRVFTGTYFVSPFSNSDSPFAGFFQTGQPATAAMFLWQGEGVAVQVRRGWSGGFDGTSYDCVGSAEAATETEIDWFVARKFSRVPPDVTYRISFPEQPEEATNVSLTPQFTQYVDAKGDSFWYLESLSIESGGENLLFPPASDLRVAADGNAVHGFRVLEFEVSRQTPEAEIGDVGGFSVQPTVTISLATTGSPAGTFYRISGATITSGGETDAADGAVSIPVVLTKGHWNAGPIALAGVISGGQLSSITVPSASPQIIAPATLTSLALLDDPFLAIRITTGRSPFKVTYEHSQPTLSAKAVGNGTDAEFTVTLEGKTDLNGDQFWEIKSAIASQVGTEHDLNSATVIDVEPPGIEAAPPVLLPIRDRAPPSLVVRTTTGGGLSVVYPMLVVQFTQRAGEFGDPYWEISGVAATEPIQLAALDGTGTMAFFMEDQDSVEFPACRNAVVTYTVDENLFFTGAQVQDGGVYYLETDGIRRLHVLNGGRFFVRNFTVSSDPLPDVSCIGPVSEAAGWDRNRFRLEFLSTDVRPDVDDEYGSEFAVRVRRCPLPEIDVEFE